MNSKKIIPSITIGAGAVILGLGLQYALASWTPAPASPPSSNVAAPINVGSGAQAKAGAFSVGTTTLPSGYSFGVTGGASIDALLTQAFTLANGTQGAGKVLTSDANGVGTWQNSSASSTGGVYYSVGSTDASFTYSSVSTWYDMPDMSVALPATYSGGNVVITFNAAFRKVEYFQLGIVVDGTMVDQTPYIDEDISGVENSEGYSQVPATIIFPMNLSSGSHTIKVQWRAGTATLGTNPPTYQDGSVSSRTLMVQTGGGVGSGGSGSSGSSLQYRAGTFSAPYGSGPYYVTFSSPFPAGTNVVVTTSQEGTANSGYYAVQQAGVSNITTSGFDLVFAETMNPATYSYIAMSAQ